MSKNLLLNGSTYTGIKTVSLPLADGTGLAQFKDVDEISEGTVVTGDEAMVAFLEGNINTFTIPDNLTTLRNGAFYNCNNLESFAASEACESYSVVDGVLYNKTGDTLILYPPSKEGANFTIPSNVNEISDFAFNVCNKLKKINAHESISTVGGNSPFDTNLQIVLALDADVLNQGGSYPWSSISSYVNTIIIPEDVTFISYNTFNYYSSIKNIYFNATNCDVELNSYDDKGVLVTQTAFSYKYLAKVVFGENVVTIPDNIFAHSYSHYEFVPVFIPRSVTSIGDNSFGTLNIKIFGYKNSYAETYAIEKGYTFISLDGSNTELDNVLALDSATLSQGGIYPNIPETVNTIIIPEDATFIDYETFGSYNYNITSIDFNATNCELDFNEASISKSTVPVSAFYNLQNLTTVRIGTSVTTIPAYMFAGLIQDVTFVIPRNVTYIDDNAFYGYYTYTIMGYSGSYAESYANEHHNISFIAIDD